jgi:hypothetical protein
LTLEQQYNVASGRTTKLPWKEGLPPTQTSVRAASSLKGVTAAARSGRNHNPEAAVHIYGTAERIIKVDLQISHFVEA